MIKIFNNPLINIKMTILRDKNTSSSLFRKTLSQISLLMLPEILKDYKTSNKNVITPNNKEYNGYTYDKDIVLIPILRAGLGMLNSFSKILDNARSGFLGLKRDEKNFKINNYIVDIPKVDKDSLAIILEPMIATGNSLLTAIKILKEMNFKKITIVSILCVKSGIDTILEKYNDIDIFVAQQDFELNNKKFIIPGLGDAGDRQNN
ncbi:MAG: uracil phosphoribosyltransferase [Mycoplasma sp.]|nr:uracil phosphoribosyltransferase [Mycoplasma sp.]